MANLILTNDCNASCAFCFAADHLSHKGSDQQQMTLDEVRDWLDWTENRELRLLGGEPTLHPQFAEIIALGREIGCPVTVFSNGVMPESALNALMMLDSEKCSVVVNLSAALVPSQRDRQREVIARLEARVTPGITLTSPDFSLLPVVSLIERYGLRKIIRIGLSNPTWGGHNRALHPKRYAAVGRALFEQSFLTTSRGIALDADCGFVRCMFGDQFEQLKTNGFRYQSRCTPVLDLCTRGDILPCFGLSNLLHLNQHDYTNVDAAFQAFCDKLEPWHRFGIYPECTDCPYFETENCCGGCLAARLRRLHPLTEAS